MLTFAEEIMVLLLHDENGAFLPVKGYALNHALAGSVLMDLAFANRIDTDLEQLKVIDREPTGNPMLDRVLGRIADSAETRNTKEWLAAFLRPERGRDHPGARVGQPRGARHPGTPGGEVPVGVPSPSLSDDRREGRTRGQEAHRGRAVLRRDSRPPGTSL